MFHSTQPWPFSFKVFAAACALGVVALTLAAQDPPAEKGAAEDPFGKKGDAKGAKEGPEPKSAFDRNRVQAITNQDPLILRHLRESNPTTPEQLTDTLAAADVKLPADVLAACNEVSKEIRYPMG